VRLLRLGALVGVAVVVGACATPRSLPPGPTPIPTLAPATQPVSFPGETAPAPFEVQSYPARLPSAELGQPLYEEQCSRCHGDDGNGVVPGARNFRDLDYMRGETPASFYAVVTAGRGQMPSFRETMTSDDRWDAVFYVWHFSTTPENLALGRGIFDTNCAACHGADGTGQVLGAADFTDLRFAGDRAPRDFYLAVTQGVGSMPAWQGRLSQDERWAVIDFLWTFAYGAGLPGEGGEISATTAAPAEACDADFLAQTNPFAWDDTTAIASGQVIYDQSCAACHAADGSGNLPAAPDMTADDYQAGLRGESGAVLCTVAVGRGSMPGWQEVLTLEQMWQVLTFTASFGS
jgi:mono/diheme cytochrome c family protein